MALINCPECKHEISDTASICPNCGYKLKTTKLNIALHKKISTVMIITGILFVVGVIAASIITHDTDNALRAAYYFGGNLKAEDLIAYQRRQAISDFVSNLGLVLFFGGIVYKIILKIKSRKTK